MADCVEILLHVSVLIFGVSTAKNTGILVKLSGVRERGGRSLEESIFIPQYYSDYIWQCAVSVLPKHSVQHAHSNLSETASLPDKGTQVAVKIRNLPFPVYSS